MCCEKIALERTTVSLLQRKAYMLINGVIALFLRCFFIILFYTLYFTRRFFFMIMYRGLLKKKSPTKKPVGTARSSETEKRFSVVAINVQ